jgi:hypothetical protein
LKCNFIESAARTDNKIKKIRRKTVLTFQTTVQFLILSKMKSKLLPLLFVLISMRVLAQDTLAIDSTLHFQTITGWGHGGGVLGGVGGPWSMLDSSIANPVNYEYLDYLVDDLGLTGSRTWEVGPRVDGTGMDNGDCDSIDWAKFQSNSLPTQLANYLIYYKNKILAKGYQPNFYSSPGYPTHATDQKPWIMYHPGERAQQIWASALYMKNTFGININYDVIYNEPQGSITATVLADDIKALGSRLIGQGLSTQSQYAEAVAPQTDWNFIVPVQNDSALWTYVGRLSYHNYGTADPYRSNIYNFGLSKGITTAQTEMGNPTFDDVYNDLTLGGVSYWEVGYSSSVTLVPDTGLTSFTPSATFFRIRQVLHYVTPGSIRIEATANDTLLHIVSFSKNGLITTVIDNTNNSARSVFLSGIPAGTYGLSQSSPGTGAFQELGVRTVSAGDTITINVNGGSTATSLYPYSGPNHSPDIMTWKTSPGYLVSPASTATLSASANDAELDAITYQWTVTSFPAGTTPVIASPNTLSTSVNGLTAAGTYVFTISVNDGINTSSKQVYLVEYGSNPQPVLGSAGFRIAAPYGLVFGNPGDTTHANIELPTSGVTLQVGIADLANSNFTGAGTWTLVQQPGGANAIVGSTTYIFVSIRAMVTGMTVPGDYIFRCNVINPGHPDLTAQIICTVHSASFPPVITSITPSPGVLTLPASTTLLTAVTSDPEGDLLRHWWAITSAPAGAFPVFDHQCLRVTDVSGLTVAGTYTFTLRCFDDLHEATQNVNVIVNATGIENISDDAGVIIYPNPASDELNIQLTDSQDKISEVTLINIFGETVSARKVNTDTTRKITLSAKSLPDGIYFLRLQTQQKTITAKVLRNASLAQ